jgi:Tol biopolymer transport system component
MNYKVVPIRVITLVALLCTLAACGQDLETRLAEPDARPSASPTQTAAEPAAAPTSEPSATATAEPAATPTAEPSATPTDEPTATPTAEPSATPTSVPSATPTAEPSATPTSALSPTPVLEADANAIIKWQKLDLPDNFHAIYAQDFGVEKGATAVQFTDSNGEPIIIPIENSFVFTDEAQTAYIFGYTFILANDDLRSAFAAKQDNLSYLETLVLSPALIDTPEIGEVCGGYTALLPEEERIESVEFLIGDVGASLFIRYPQDQPPPVDILKLAQVYADSLVNPQPRCQIVSVTPVEDARVPEFEFEAAGFFPEEQRIVELFAAIGDEEDPLTLSNSMLGQTGETSDSDGNVSETIGLAPLLEEGGNMPVISLKLTVVGGFSGCKVSEELSWPYPVGLSAQYEKVQPGDEPRGHIAYQSATEDTGAIYALDLQTGEIEELTYMPGAGDWSPEWSPDGSRLLFSTGADIVGEEIYILESDGAYRKLTDNFVTDTHAVWSPDGSEIAFVSDVAENMDIYLMELESGEISRLTQEESLDWMPAWSPDGRQIIFESDRDGNYELYKMNRDGSDLVRLTNNDAIDTSPAWSPDGEKIAFNSSRAGMFQIFILDLASGEIVQLTEGSSENRHPAWSPDGRFIAYDSMSGESLDIFIMKADGSNQQQMTFEPANEAYPSWTGERHEFEKKPYWHRPVCAIDTDGDNFPDAPAETWPLNEELYFVVFLFRNMEDGMEWSHAWTDLNSDVYSIVPAVWDGGEEGAKTIYSSLPGQEPAVWEIEFRLEGELMDVIQCPVVE